MLARSAEPEAHDKVLDNNLIRSAVNLSVNLIAGVYGRYLGQIRRRRRRAYAPRINAGSDNSHEKINA